MKLYGSFTSPYVRRVRVVALLLGIEERIEWVAASPYDTPAALLAVNPLSRIPALVTDSGQILPDSAVICDYLCAEFGGERLLPVSGERRWQILHLATLAEGIIDGALDLVMLRRRNITDAVTEERQLGKIRRTLHYLAQDTAPALSLEDASLYEITLGCALGYLRFRLPELFAEAVPHTLQYWFGDFGALPALVATAPREG